MIKRIYDWSPVFIQDVACTLKGHLEKKSRLGGEFNSIYESLKETEWEDESYIEDFQVKKLRDLIEYCDKNIPYYKELFKKINLNSLDINTIKDLEKIPILTKELVRENFEKLKNPNFKGEIVHAHTSGSTGKSLQFDFSKDAILYRWALW